MEVTNEDTTDWWANIDQFLRTNLRVFVALFFYTSRFWIHSDLYWIDCTVQLEKFLELKHYQVYMCAAPIAKEYDEEDAYPFLTIIIVAS